MKTEHNILMSDVQTRSDSEVLELSFQNPVFFEILVERYKKEFNRKAFRIVRDKDEAEDIVQDVFVKMYKYGKRFKHQEGATFKSWAYKILTNTCFTYCAKRKRRAEFLTRADEDMMESFSTGAKEFDRMLDLNQVYVALQTIPKLLARMLTLSLQGKTQEEIAAMEGIPVGTVRTRLHRAKKEIRKTI